MVTVDKIILDQIRLDQVRLDRQIIGIAWQSNKSHTPTQATEAAKATKATKPGWKPNKNKNKQQEIIKKHSPPYFNGYFSSKIWQTPPQLQNLVVQRTLVLCDTLCQAAETQEPALVVPLLGGKITHFETNNCNYTWAISIDSQNHLIGVSCHIFRWQEFCWSETTQPKFCLIVATWVIQ